MQTVYQFRMIYSIDSSLFSEIKYLPAIWGGAVAAFSGEGGDDPSINREAKASMLISTDKISLISSW